MTWALLASSDGQSGTCLASALVSTSRRCLVPMKATYSASSPSATSSLPANALMEELMTKYLS